MIGKNTIKWVHSLEMKKNRLREGLFVAEGPKVVGDLLGHYRLHTVFATDEWMNAHGKALQADSGQARIEVVDDEQLRRLSFLQHPQQVIAIFHIPDNTDGGIDLTHQLTLMLDGIQDPGNLGTIIRIADWFAIDHIICSNDTADAYNPKVVQATMGSLARVGVHYADLPALLDSLRGEVEVYGTLLDGTDIYSTPLNPQGIIIMGNEGKGISAEVRRHVTRPLLIPNFRHGDGAESLNVAVATAITCSEFRRNN